MRSPSRAGVYGLATLLSATCLSLLPTTSADAAGIDPAPAALSAGWLRTQLSGNVLTTGAGGSGTVDVEASMDAAGGFQAAGDPTTAAAVTAALGSGTPSSISSYVGTEPDTDANHAARAASFAQSRGQDLATYGAVPGGLVTRLTDQIDDTTGRLTDDAGATPTDLASTAGQADAVGVLGRLGNAEASAASTYLRALQCGPGYLPAALPATGTAASCPAGSVPSVSATSTAVVALNGVAALQDVRDRAAAWLVTAQQANGRWTEDGGAGPGDAVTTGLAGAALALVGRTGPAAQAAIWLRGQQLLNAGTCASYAAADAGAVALDMTRFNAAVTPIGASGDAVVSSFRRATARALAVQVASPGGPAVTDNSITVPRFSKPGRQVQASLRAAPRNLLCASAPTLAATRLVVSYDSTASFAFTAAADGPTTASIIDPSGQVDSATVTSLGKKKLRFSFRDKRVRAGKVAVVKVKGLAPAESVRVKFRGQRKNATTANSRGKAKLRFIVSGKRGFVGVRVIGQYANRNRAKNIIVVR